MICAPDEYCLGGECLDKAHVVIILLSGFHIKWLLVDAHVGPAVSRAAGAAIMRAGTGSSGSFDWGPMKECAYGGYG